MTNTLLEQDLNQPSETRAGSRMAAGASAEPAGLTDSARHPDPAPTEPIGGRSPRDLPCHLHDPDLWFADSPADLERAKALCATCPVRLECLAGALRRREPCGVWGGEIVRHGQVLPFKRGRGRPRIHFPAASGADRPRKSPDRTDSPGRRGCAEHRAWRTSQTLVGP
ncbi:MAG TPA: WhiB family transcriptional regulator [Jatrophihabitantaceae bacterium]|nr:WhiB family transcriptional regulator [Jatrophihabitantaceae bacterium]